MKNGRFTPDERKYLLSLDAVESVTARCIIYSKTFKQTCMQRYHQGERPGVIFASAGLPASLIGYKRIERAIYHWKEAENKDALCLTSAPSQKRKRRIETLKQEKRDAVARQRDIRERRIKQMEEKLAKQKAKSEREKEKIIAAQAAEIASLKAQVKALKANGTLAKKTKRTPYATKKSERFELIFQLKSEDPNFNISAACKALDVSRRGYYNWVTATPKRVQRESADNLARKQIEQAFCSHGAKKGSREIVDNLVREQGIIMNRKKVQRIMRKFDIKFSRKRKNPYHPIGSDGMPKVADNVLNREFHQNILRKVLVTDITYIPYSEGFTYLSVILDAQSNEVLAYVASLSLEEKFVLDTFNQLKEMKLNKDVLCHSDQGAHYTARAYREKLAELSIKQSMSRKACCWDNACIESFFGRMKAQIGSTDKYTFDEVCATVDEYMDYYNNYRGQARLGWLTPKEYASKLAA
jgi:putative transposase